MLCCAFIHCEIFEGLTSLGISAVDSEDCPLRTKTIDLLVSLVRTIARVCPESQCVTLLSMPAVIELSSRY